MQSLSLALVLFLELLRLERRFRVALVLLLLRCELVEHAIILGLHVAVEVDNRRGLGFSYSCRSIRHLSVTISRHGSSSLCFDCSSS